MPGGIRLNAKADSDIDAPPPGRVTIFLDATSGEPSYKDDDDNVHSLRPPLATTEEFVATGGSPETFTLAATPAGVRRVYLEGVRLAAADVGGTDDEVEIDTTAGDIVIVDYEV